MAISETTNRITDTPYAYDGAGNLTNDSLHTYTYDGENRIKTVDGTGATYTYDTTALRVKKVVGATTTVYIFSGSKVVAEYVNGSLSKEYVYAGSTLLATVASGGATTYQYPDHLSTRVEANDAGTVTRTFAHYPFGETWYETGTASKWKFTSYERDSESGLDQAVFRYDSSRLARFMSPDPLAGRLSNPQSLNRFSYVLNDPVNLIDPTGLDCVSVTTADEFRNTHTWVECDGGPMGGGGAPFPDPNGGWGNGFGRGQGGRVPWLTEDEPRNDARRGGGDCIPLGAYRLPFGRLSTC
ncbi:MAG: RHS repeat-associated core domain-containing protein [Terriglobales bacterium]